MDGRQHVAVEGETVVGPRRAACVALPVASSSRARDEPAAFDRRACSSRIPEAGVSGSSTSWIVPPHGSPNRRASSADTP